MPTLRSLPIVLVVLLQPAWTWAQPVRLLESSSGGVTLELTLGPWHLEPEEPGGRRLLQAQGLEHWAEPGRPLLPSAHVSLGLPPGARASVRVLEQEAGGEEQAHLVLGKEPFFFPSPDGGKESPALRELAPIRDGPYPASAVWVSEPLEMRSQWIVGVRITPFVYEEERGRVQALRRLKVRVDFSMAGSSPVHPERLEAPAPEDRHFESVFQATLLNYEEARSWRMPRPRAARLGLDIFRPADESRSEVRVRVDTTGVYRVDYSQLAAAGFPAGTPVGEVEAHRHEFVSGQADPPFVNVAVPLELKDLDGDGTFGGADYLIYYAQNFAERARASTYQRLWGIADYVFVSSSAAPGARIATRDAQRGLAPPTPEPWFRSSRRYERDFDFYPLPPDTSSDPWVWVTNDFDGQPSPPDSFRFDCSDVDTSVSLRATVAWRGRKQSEAHAVWADLVRDNGVTTNVADSLVWFDKSLKVASRTLFGSSVGEGSTNRLRIRGYSSPSKHYSDASLDWFELDYGRRYRAIRDYLDCNSSGAQGWARFQVGNFGSAESLEVYDVTDSTAPVRLVVPLVSDEGGGRFAVEFEDSIPSGTRKRYVAFRSPRAVLAGYVSAVDRRRLTAAPPGSRVDYLAITFEDFESALAPLVALRQSQGLNVLVAPVQAVFDEFNGGRRSPHAIRRFVQFAFNNWSARFLLLVGDASQDPLAHQALAGSDHVPGPLILGPVGIGDGLELVNSDHWYVWCLNGGCSANAAQFPDLFVGRLPVGSLAEAQAIVAKLTAYEQFSAADLWRNRVLLCADDPYSTNSFFGGGGGGGLQYCRKPEELIFRQIMDTNAGIIRGEGRLRSTQVVRFNLYDYLAGQPYTVNPPSDTCRNRIQIRNYTTSIVTPQLRGLLENGVLLWDFQGHANETVLTHEYLWNALGSDQDIDRVQNAGRPFFFSGYACHINQFGRTSERDFIGDGLGERLVLASGGRGAVGSYASTGYEYLPLSNTNHLDVALVRSFFSMPPFDPYLGDHGARVVVGEAIAAAYVRYLPFTFYDRGVSQTYELLGDPAQRLSTAGPQSFVTANGDTVTEGVVLRLHTPQDTLHIRAEIAAMSSIESIVLEHVRGSVIDTIPPSRYSLAPAFPDTLVNGGRFYSLNFDTTLEAASYSYVLRTTDRYGLSTSFRIPFEFTTVLRVDGSAIGDGDPVSPSANLSLLVLVPKPVTPAEMELKVDGILQPHASQPVPGDASGREWILSWTHDPYRDATFAVELRIGGEVRIRTFRVTSGAAGVRLEQVAAFPNPFEDDLGCHFSFLISSAARSELLLRVFTPTGRLVYERRERDLDPGYHQLAWDGRDAEGQKLANGTYLYRLIVKNPLGDQTFTGRLVKFRKPKRVAEPQGS